MKALLGTTSPSRSVAYAPDNHPYGKVTRRYRIFKTTCRTYNLWRMRCLIVGGTRIIGPHVVRRLYARGWDIAVLHLVGTERGPIEPTPLTENAPLRDRLFPYRRSATSADELNYWYDKILVELLVAETLQKLTE